MSVFCFLKSFSCLQHQRCLQSFLSLAIGAMISSAWCAAMAQENTDPVELRALFEVMTSINSDVDWKTRLSDPCMGSQHGVYCMADDNGMYHVTNLEFGFISEYDSLITCSGNASLHPSISLLPFLETLFIYNCFVNGSDATIPTEIGQLSSSLEMLTLHGNPKLGGGLPAELGNLTSLQRLVLTENSIGGMIPEEFGNLRSLLQLDLSENQLYGAIPDSLNSLQSLVILDLGYNVLSGNLPSLGRLSGLQELVLSNNNLSGIIPEDFGSLSSLTYLDLSRNNLSGGIPSSFVNLTKLEDVYLESNNMRSPLPDVVGSMVGLSRLSLSESGFLGEIPHSLGELVNLRVLLLQGNNFSGHIPPTLGGLPKIYQLDLSANNLTGPVPFSPAFVAKLGTNLIVLNNLGLCIPSSSLREGVAALGVSVCDEGNSLEDSGLEAHPPNPAPGLGQHQSNDAREPFQKIVAYKLICLIAFLSYFPSWRNSYDECDGLSNSGLEALPPSSAPGCGHAAPGYGHVQLQASNVLELFGEYFRRIRYAVEAIFLLAFTAWTMILMLHHVFEKLYVLLQEFLYCASSRLKLFETRRRILADLI